MVPAASICLETKDLWFAYEPQSPVLKGISLAIPEGDFVAVLGQNGSGKTTLVKHFNGLLRPLSGQVSLFGQDLRNDKDFRQGGAFGPRSIGELARDVGYVFQNPDHQIFSATVRQEIAFGLRNLGLEAGEVHRRVEQTLATFHLERYAAQQPAALSYGLRRMVTIAAVYAMSPRVLILDEPTTGLDWKSVAGLMDLLLAYHRQGNTILLITHDMRLVADFIPRCLVVEAGQVLTYCETRQFFRSIDTLDQAHLGLPQITRLARRLEPSGLRADILTVAEFCREVPKLSLEGADQ
jgi:energy-coupling factor transport system ATP-binding protein